MESAPRTSRGLPSVGVSIKHHLVTVVVATGFILGLAWLYTANLTSTYTASSVVLLSPAPGNPLTAETASGSGVQLTVAMETEAELVRTSAVRDVVSGQMGRPVPGPGESIGVSVPSNTQMLELRYTAATPEAAQEGAQGLAEGYLGYREERASATQEARIEALRAQVEATDENLRRSTAEAAEGGASSYASQEVQLFADRLAQLNNSLSAAEAVGTAPGSIINPAALPTESNELSPWAFLVAGAGLGLLGGTGLAMLREWRRDLVRDDEAVDELGIPVFASIRRSSEVALVATTQDNAHESYRRLRAAVIANGPRPHVLAVTAIGGERASGVAANLAVVLSEAKFSVLLIGAVPQASEIEDLMGVTEGGGIVSALSARSDARRFLVQAHGVSVLAGGLRGEGSRDLTASPEFRGLVEDLRQDFDYVVLDAAAAGSADGDAVLLAADSALLVLTPDWTTRERLNAALERFEQLSVVPIGAVKVSRQSAGVAAAGRVAGGAARELEEQPR